MSRVIELLSLASAESGMLKFPARGITVPRKKDIEVCTLGGVCGTPWRQRGRAKRILILISGFCHRNPTAIGNRCRIARRPDHAASFAELHVRARWLQDATRRRDAYHGEMWLTLHLTRNRHDSPTSQSPRYEFKAAEHATCIHQLPTFCIDHLGSRSGHALPSYRDRSMQAPLKRRLDVIDDALLYIMGAYCAILAHRERDTIRHGSSSPLS